MAVLASVFVPLGIKRKLEHSLPDQKSTAKSGDQRFRSVAKSHTRDSQPPTRHPATALNRAGGSHCCGDISGSFLAKAVSFCYCSGQVGSFIEPRSASNFRDALCRTLSQLTFWRPLTALPQSATSWTVWLGIALAPLLPSEQETEYADSGTRIVKAATPRDAIEDLLTRDCHRLVLGGSSAAPIKGRAFEGRDLAGFTSDWRQLTRTSLLESLPPTGPPERKLRRKKSSGRFRRRN